MFSTTLSLMGSLSTVAAMAPGNGDDGQHTFNILMLLLTIIQVLLGLGASP